MRISLKSSLAVCIIHEKCSHFLKKKNNNLADALMLFRVLKAHQKSTVKLADGLFLHKNLRTA